MYKSTRSNEMVTASMAIIKGLADDGGLYLPCTINKLAFDQSFLNYDYQTLAKIILKHFLDDFTETEIAEVVEQAYNNQNFSKQMVGITPFENHSFLELYYGPTLAFKDMALTILPYLLEVAKRKNHIDKKTLVLVATSGDTGGAALSSFGKMDNTEMMVFYPHQGISEMQESQMLYYTNNNAKTYAYEGNFDDCQTLVKDLFANHEKSSERWLTSANSINIGRLLPQIIYYFYSYFQLVKLNKIKWMEEIQVSVPTGNFGNILASYMASLMGLPIKRFICASNHNDVLTDFFKTGIYNRNRKFYKTNSPSMDILISSNLERLIALMSNDSEYVAYLMKNLKETGQYQISHELMLKMQCFIGYSIDSEQTCTTIHNTYQNLHYLIDPHTAVAYQCYLDDQIQTKSQYYTVIVSTASPYKFPRTVGHALAIMDVDNEFTLCEMIEKRTCQEIPGIIKEFKKIKTPRIIVNRNHVEHLFNKTSIIVKTPATTANLGLGFDFLGMALKIVNQYKFTISETMQVHNFLDDYDFNNNLVVKAYLAYFEKVNETPVPVSICLEYCDIPLARGLGSSASCITAGGVAARWFAKKKLDEEEMLKLFTEIEGHPDNVVPCYLGGVIASLMDNGHIYSSKVNIHRSLHFTCLIPDFELSTQVARKALPCHLLYEDVINNTSRVFWYQKALETGDFEMLKILLNDKLHEPYRFPLIEDALDIKKQILLNAGICLISGAGPSLLVVSKNKFTIKLDNMKHNWRIIPIEIDNKGVEIYEADK